MILHQKADAQDEQRERLYSDLREKTHPWRGAAVIFLIAIGWVSAWAVLGALLGRYVVL